MKITVVGWYGTETIGDRAILVGLLSFFNKVYKNFEINLGSLYPFFSERTINEDYLFWKQILGKDLKISLFDSRVSKELEVAIKESDLVVMGGGPLMHIDPMYMILYAFKKAKMLNKKTAILGCGVGPILTKKFKKLLAEIIYYADLIILRDNISKKNLVEILNEIGRKVKEKEILTSYDPSVETCLLFNKFSYEKYDDYIAVNLRNFPSEYSTIKNFAYINENIIKFVKSLAEQFDREIKLIPMHYFHIGGDDREFLNYIKLKLNMTNLIVQNENLSVIETMKMYKNAYFNIGMRFHSIIFQTILNGKNYILDYTEPQKGKILGFLKDIDNINFYTRGRYVCLQEDDIYLDFSNINRKFEINEKAILDRLNIYIENLALL